MTQNENLCQQHESNEYVTFKALKAAGNIFRTQCNNAFLKKVTRHFDKQLVSKSSTISKRHFLFP